MMIPSPKSSWAFPLRAAIRLAVCLALALLFAGCRSTASPATPGVIADDLGSVVAATDRAGAVVERYAYDDFGSPTIYAPGGTTVRTHSLIDNDVLFAGARWHADLGLYWMRYRWYDPATGRFLTQDPIGLWGDPFNLGNGMAYVGHSPGSWVDAFGLCSDRGIFDWMLDTFDELEWSKSDFLGDHVKNNHPIQMEEYRKGKANQYLNETAENTAASAAAAEALIREANGSDAALGVAEGLSTIANGDAKSGMLMVGAGVLPGVSAGAVRASKAFGTPPAIPAPKASAGTSPGGGGGTPPGAGAAGPTPKTSLAPFRKGDRLPPIIIGESMSRVERYAGMVDGQHIGTYLGDQPSSKEFNEAWMKDMIAQGRCFVDVGPDFARRKRRVDEGENPASEIYEMERRLLKDYPDLIPVFERKGKLDGGVPGLDY